MTRLTKKQAEYLNHMERNGETTVGYISRPIMRVFDNLVEKGYAEVVEEVGSYVTYDLSDEYAEKVLGM